MHPWGFCSEGGGGKRGGEERSKKGRQQQLPFSLPLPPSPFKSQIFSLLTPKEGLILRL